MTLVSYLFLSHCKSMGANDPWGRAIFDPRGTVGRIYKEDHYTLLHTKYDETLWFRRRRFFYVFPMTPPGPVWTPGARLAGFMAGPVYIATYKI